MPELSRLVSLENIGKSFASGVTALDHFNLDIAIGEFLSLLGPSGCGKSTLLRMIAGLIKPDKGRIEWSDKAGIDHRSSIGFVFQEPTLMPWANVIDNIWLPLRLRGLSKRDALPRIESCLELVGLMEFGRLFPYELSGGMSMRVSIARALTLKPRLLLLDEPFAALDEMTRFRLNDDLLQLHKELDCTILFVTHSVYESVYLSHRIAVMSARSGRVAAQIKLDPNQPRDMAFRTSQAYAEICGEASRALLAASHTETAS